jgi:hypothetical protein
MKVGAITIILETYTAMPRLKETSATLLEINLPSAIAAGWTVKRLATACHCGERAAGEALQRYRQSMRERMARKSGDEVETMRAGATAERKATLSRLATLGALSDSLLAEASALLVGQDGAERGQGRAGGLESGEVTLKVDALTRVAVLDRVAGILLKAGKAAELSWNLCRSASGLGMAERLAEAKAKGAMKSGRSEQPEVWEADFELIEPNE